MNYIEEKDIDLFLIDVFQNSGLPVGYDFTKEKDKIKSFLTQSLQGMKDKIRLELVVNPIFNNEQTKEIMRIIDNI